MTLPLAAPGSPGAMLCFARALGEFGATAPFAGNMPEMTRTVPFAIYAALSGGAGGQDQAAALALELLRAKLLASPGERIAVIGPNGSGELTMLQAVEGAVSLTRGSVALGQRELSRVDAARRQASFPAMRRGIGLLAQEPLLFAHLSVRANVAYGPRAHSAAKPDALARPDELLGALGARDLAELRPAALSGGERQRVALARVLASDPGLLLLDEAFSALDVSARPAVRAPLARWLDHRPIAVLFVTHDLFDVTALAGPRDRSTSPLRSSPRFSALQSSSSRREGTRGAGARRRGRWGNGVSTPCRRPS